MYRRVAILLQGIGLLSSPCFAAPDAAVLASGKEVYGVSCAQCHADGAGNAMMPALLGSPLLKQAPDATARIILFGRRGGEGRGIMPAQAWLSDAEIAAVVVYVRAAFANEEAAFSKEEVAALRPSP